VSIPEILFLILFWTWAGTTVFFVWTTILPPTPLTVTPAAWSVPFESVVFRATDGVRLAGWKLISSSQDPWILVCHGLGTNRADGLEVSLALWKADYNILSFDFRAHGESAGRASSFGWLEQRDLEGALALLGRDPEVAERPYGVFGLSMGGCVAVMVAARDERLGAVAVDSIYGDLGTSLIHHVQLMYRLPRVPFGWFVASAYRLRFGVWPQRMAPQRAVAQISPRPLLVIHGGQDLRVPLPQIQTLFDAAREPKQLLVMEGAGHLGAFHEAPAAYVSCLVNFFDSSLKYLEH